MLVATATMVESTRIMKKPASMAHSAFHGLACWSVVMATDAASLDRYRASGGATRRQRTGLMRQDPFPFRISPVAWKMIRREISTAWSAKRSVAPQQGHIDRRGRPVPPPRSIITLNRCRCSRSIASSASLM